MALVRAMLVEALAAVRAQRVVSLLTVLVVLGGTTTVLVTAGRAEGAQTAVLARMEQVGTRTVTVHATGDGAESMTADVVGRLERYDVVASATGFGSTTDVRAAGNPAGALVAVREVHGELPGAPPRSAAEVAGARQVWATPLAVDVLGLPERGMLRAPSTDVRYLVSRHVDLPDAVRSWDPVLLAPPVSGAEDGSAPISTLVVVAGRAADVVGVRDLVRGELRHIPPEDLMVETSQDLATAYALVDGELTQQNRAVVLGALGAAVGAVTVVVWGAALIRRRDFGRRRALGATRRMIVTLVVGQVALLSVAGGCVGAVAGSAWLWWAGHPLPDASYMIAVAVVMAATTATMSALPAWWAACRDPLTELRVP